MQAVESAALSLAQFRERAAFASPKPKRDIAHALMTVYWVNGVSACSNGANYKALERRFAPLSAACNDAEPVFSNLWLNYFLGRHTPTRVLSKVESAIPGANASLRSPLWPALKGGAMGRARIFKLLACLEPEIRDVVWASARAGTAGAKQAAMLELRAGLDALGAQVLLLRLAHVNGQQESACEWGRRIWRLMMLLGSDLKRGGIAQALADLLEEVVMPMASMNGIRFGFPPQTYFRLIAMFEHAIALVDQRSPGPKSRRQLLRIGRDLLDLKWGFGDWYAFKPLRLLDPSVQTSMLAAPSARELQRVAEDLNLHRWGSNMQKFGGHRHLPPSAARSGQDLWAINPTGP